MRKLQLQKRCMKKRIAMLLRRQWISYGSSINEHTKFNESFQIQAHNQIESIFKILQQQKNGRHKTQQMLTIDVFKSNRKNQFEIRIISHKSHSKNQIRANKN